MPSRLLSAPKPGETITVLAADNADPYVLDIDPSTATATQEGNNLIIITQNGGRVIFQNFYAKPDATPPLLLEGDETIPLEALQPAAGPQQAEAQRDGSSQDFAESALLQGIDALGGLDLSGEREAPRLTPLLDTLEDDQRSTSETALAPPPNTPPTVDAANSTAMEDDAISVSGQLPPPRDANAGDRLSFLPKAEAGLYGTLSLLTDGTYTYTLNNTLPAVQALGANQMLTESFTYTVSDGQGGTASNTLTITIKGDNDIPTVADAAASISEGVQNTIMGTLPMPQDVDAGDVLTFTPKVETGTTGTLTLLADGSYTFALNSAAVQNLGAGQSLTETFTYTVNDGQGGTATNTLTLTINGTNDNPTVAAAVGEVTEDTLTTLSATLPMPQDVDTGDVVTFIPKNNEAGTYGTLTLLADGTYTYTLNNADPTVQSLGVGQSVTETFTYTVSDAQGGTGSNTLTITVKGTNDAPTVAAAVASINEGVQTSIMGSLPTPQDVDASDVLTFTPKVESGSTGTLTLLADGSYTFALNSAAVQNLGTGQSLTETFSYTVNDGQGGTATNTLTLTIQGNNDNPTVAAAVGEAIEDTLTTLSATLPMPQDVDTGDVVTFVPKNNEAGVYGSLTLLADGTYTYTLNNADPTVQSLGVGQSLTETFTYTVSDGQGGTGSNTLTITVKGTNDTPLTIATTEQVTEDLTLTASGLLTAIDIDNPDTLTFTPLALQGQYGSLTVNSAGYYVYTLDNASPQVQALGKDVQVTDSFPFTVTDNHGASASNVVSITVHGVNDAPTVAAVQITAVEDTATVVQGLLTPQDVDAGDVLTFTPKVNEPGTYGTLTLLADGTYTYTLNNADPAVQSLGVGQTLSETFTYTVNDGQGGTASNTLTVTIKGTNDAPTVAAATAALVEDILTTVTGTLPAPQDRDVGDSPVFVPQTNQAGAYGSLTLSSNGTYTYTLNNNAPAVQALGVNQTLTETLTYAVNDGKGGTGTNTLTLTIHGTNDAPVALAAVTSVTEDTKITATGTLPVTDRDNLDVLTFTPKAGEAGNYGSLTLLANGTYTYTLNNTLPVVQTLGVGQTLTETFTYTVNDAQGVTRSNTLTVTVKGTNDRPTVAAASASVTEDTKTTVTGTLPAPQDIDVGDSPFFIPKTNQAGTYGSLTLSSNGTYTYVLNNNSPAVQSLGVGQSVSEGFSYTVSDGKGGTGFNLLTITINGTNDAPLTTAVTGKVTEDLTLTAQGLVPAMDIDSSDTLTFTPLSLQGQYGSLTLNSAGYYVYTLSNASPQVQALGKNALAMDSFTYTVTDNHGASTTNTLTFTVTGVNDAPKLAAAQVAAAEDTFTVVQGTLAAQDVDAGDTLAFLPKVHEPGLYGSLTLGGNGAYTYTLNNALPVVQGLGVGDTLTETFFVVVRDQYNALTTATLSVSINGTNDAPVAQAFAAAVTEDLATTVNGRLWATDPDNTLDGQGSDTVSFTAATMQGSYGSLVLQADGSYTYTLNNALGAVQGLTTGERLNDVFTYTVRDNYGGTNTNTLTIVVNGNNDNPITKAATDSLQGNDSLTLYGTLPTPTDPDNTKDSIQSDTLHFLPIVDGHGTYGTLQMDDAGRYSYVLNTKLRDVQDLREGESLQEVFNYAVLDDHGGVSVNTFTLTIYGPTHCKPEDNGGYSGGGSLLFAACLDVSEDMVVQAQTSIGLPLGFLLVGRTMTGEYGTLTINANGSATYVLNNTLPAVQALGAGDTVMDHFTYLLSGLLGTVTVSVHGTNDVPTPQIFTNVVTEDSTLVVTGSLRPVADVDISDSHFFTAQSGLTSPYGTLYLSDNGSYVYVLNSASQAVQALGAGQSVLDSFTYKVADNAGGSTQGTLRITVQGSNDDPAVADASLVLHEDAGSVSGVLPAPMDVDASGMPYHAAKELDTAFGHISIAADGSYTYVLSHNAVQSLSAGQTALDGVSYTVSDGKGGMATAHLSITIQGANDAPTVAAATALVTEDTLLTAYGQLPPPVDVDAIDIPSFIPINYMAGLYGSLDVRASGVYTYTLNNDHPQVQALSEGENLTEIFTYTVSDGRGGTTTNTLTMLIQGSNDLPTVGAAVGDMNMYAFGSTPQSLVGTLPATQDVDIRDIPTYSLLGDGNGTYGTLHIQADGNYSYTPHANSLLHGLSASQSVTETFRFSADDGHGGVAENTLTLTVRGINDAPLSGVVNIATAQEDGPAISGVLTLPADPDNLGGTVDDLLSFTPQSSQGIYGSLVLQSNGSYTYTLDNSLSAVQALGEQDTLTESFVCQVSDGKGGFASTMLEISVQGMAEPVPPVLEPLQSPPSTLPPDSSAPSTDTGTAASAPVMSSGLGSIDSNAGTTDTTDMQEQMLQQSIQNGN